MDKLTLYFDRNVGKRLPSALSKLRPPAEIRWHQGEGLAHDLPDDVWLERVAKRNWVVLTQDMRFHVNESEHQAVRQHAVRCFYLPGAQDGMWQTLCTFTRIHKKILELSVSTPAPFIFAFSASGRYKRIL
jgi:PIN like domain